MKNRPLDFKAMGPIVGVPLLITVVLAIYNPILGFLGALLTGYVTWHVLNERRKKEAAFVRYVESLGTNFDSVAKNAVFSMPFALALTDAQGNLMWYNSHFATTSGRENLLGTQIAEAIPGLAIQGLAEDDPPMEVELDGARYIFHFTLLRDEKTEEVNRVLLYGLDYTEEGRIKQAYQDESLVLGLVFLDNYEEIRSGASESERTLIFANIDNIITRYFQQHAALVRKYESDKYLVVLDQKEARAIIEKRFDLLDLVKSPTEEEKAIPPSLSIGFGMQGENPADAYARARTAMDVALGRGGDQAVVKHETAMDFYGGKNKAVEKRTKVKSRVISHAMQQLIDQSDQVFVMGHKNADMDSFGSAIGVLAAVRMRGKRGYLVLGDINPSISEIVTAFEEAPQEERPHRIDGPEALDRFTNQSLLVVVDTHRAQATEEPALLEEANRIVLLDHHRRGADYIQDPTLTYLEPYASSTSELVTEMLQYMDDSQSLTKREAEALLAGIMVDTKNFYYQTGVRTFEAASLLKRAGADSLAVKRFFKDGFDTYLAKAGVVKNTRILEDHIAVGRLYGIREDGMLIAAQSADEMLGIRSINASFVLSEIEDGTHISARSLGDISVQLILEKIGGGGHQTAAGAQLKGLSMDEAEEKLVAAIRAYEQEENNE